jgi:tetratricopeptide (TPR) repeat protein
MASQSGNDRQQPAQATLVPLSAETVTDIQRAIDEERYLDAGNLLDQALVVSGGDARLLLLAGRLNLARGRNADALTNFKAIETDANAAAGAREGEGIALSLLGRSNEAVAALQDAVARDPAAWRVERAGLGI